MSDSHSAVGSYVADALEPEEHEEFEAHLMVCDICQREVAELTETSAELARLVEIPPPPELRSSVLAAIREVRPLPPEHPVERPVEPAPPRPGVSAEQAWAAVPDDELARRRRQRDQRLRRVLTGLVAAAMVVALALGGWVYTLNTQRQTQVAASDRVTRLLSAPDAKVLTSANAGARYSFVVSQQRNEALFIGTDLPDPGPGKTYQLWTLQGDAARRNQAVPGYGRTEKWFSGSVEEATQVAINVEPVGRTGNQPIADTILAAPKV